MLEHGGGILAASRRYGIAPADWLDLSTGINPQGWPVPAIPASVWQRLPEADDGLIEAAAAYYGSTLLLPIAGSQVAIQALPRLRPRARVGIVSPTYAEHAQAWQRQGHAVTLLRVDDIEKAVNVLDVLVLCNPNNPTGHLFEPSTLLRWQQKLAKCGGWLLVDEAFMDATPQYSLLPETGAPGLIVLRSLGKFFGLAGARVGFAFAWPELLEELSEALGPWPVSGPARLVAREALLDERWQVLTRARLKKDAARLATLLEQAGLRPSGCAGLFQWVKTARAGNLHESLARQGILTRYFGKPQSLRFGLPGSEEDWIRLADVLVEDGN